MVAYRVGIIGAGVVGLNTAIALQDEFGEAVQITIIAEKFGTETTSDGAAGLFLPASYFNGPTEDLTFRWIQDSYSSYDAIRRSDEGRTAGIEKTSGYLFSKVNAKKVENPFMKNVSEVYRPATEEELSSCPDKAKYGKFLTTFSIECRRFLPWAEKRVCEKGAVIEKGIVTGWSELASRFDVVFNCMGLGAKELCNDRRLVPIRGQVFKVFAPWQNKFVYGDDCTYIIPIRDIATLGGSRSFDNYNLNVCPYESAAIWERCCSLVPSIKKAKVLREWVGLRPHRDPVRVETEFFKVPSHGILKVIHNYGHGGYGVTSAPGTAKHACKLFKDLHRSSSSHL